MDINGFHIVSSPVASKPDDENREGFSSTVTDKDGVVRGPFATIKEAILCANAWKKENETGALAKLKAVEESAPGPTIEQIAVVEKLVVTSEPEAAPSPVDAPNQVAEQVAETTGQINVNANAK